MLILYTAIMNVYLAFQTQMVYMMDGLCNIGSACCLNEVMNV